MIFDEMACRCGEWLRGSGPESDIVMSSRIRLARNLAEYPFIRRCNDFDRVNIEASVRERLADSGEFGEFTFIDVADLDLLDRQLLVERQLISRELSDADGARGQVLPRRHRALDCHYPEGDSAREAGQPHHRYERSE